MQARQLAQGGIFTALSVVMLCGGSFVQILSWSICMIAGFVPAIFLIKQQPKLATLVYLSTSILGTILVADKSVAFLYATFFGLYTLLKYQIERLHKLWAEILLKTAYALAFITLLLLLLQFGFVPDVQEFMSWGRIGFYLGGVAIFYYYDFCFTKILMGIRYLVHKYRL